MRVRRSGKKRNGDGMTEKMKEESEEERKQERESGDFVLLFPPCLILQD